MSKSSGRRVVVVGGGLAGLSAAYRLSEQGLAVTVIEARDRLGGQIWTEHREGFLIEIGAEGFVARGTSIAALCDELGLSAEIVDQKTTLTYLADGKTLVALAAGEAAERLGFQVPKQQLGRGIRTLASGMGGLVRALEDRLAAKAVVLVNRSARRIDRRAGALIVHAEPQAELAADAVVVATSAPAAAPLLAAVGGSVAPLLEQAPLLSSLSVNLAYPEAALGAHPPGSGFIVEAQASRYGFRACSFVKTRFPDRAPAGWVLLRAFFRPDETELETLPDADWVRRTVECIEEVLDLRGDPERTWVARWPRALPVHDAAHGERVAAVEAALVGSGVFLAGSAFHGAGIEAAVQSAGRAADDVIEHLG